MKRLRTISTRRLLIAIGAVALLAITAGIAQGALSGSTSPPPSKPLNQAVVDAANAPKVDGLTASITFDNHLIPAGALPEGSTSPLLSGAKGRLWVTNDGRFRLELQSQGGDAQIVSDGKTVTVFDANSNTAYKFDVPQGKKGDEAKRGEHKPVTLDQVNKAITEISKHWSLSGADPTTTAGQPSYTVRVSPKDDGGLLGAAEVAWDADNGVPLRAAIYADNQDSPVLELKADDISFAQVPESDVAVSAPADAKVVDMSSRQDKAAGKADAAHRNGKREAHRAQTVEEVQAKVGFPVVAPDTLAGLPRQGVRTVEHGDGPAGAVAIYGKGLGAIAVLQQDAKAAKEKPDAKGDGDGGHRGRDLELPTININGASGQELATALGTVITFERNGVSYTVAGSVPPQAAETAARELQ